MKESLVIVRVDRGLIASRRSGRHRASRFATPPAYPRAGSVAPLGPARAVSSASVTTVQESHFVSSPPIRRHAFSPRSVVFGSLMARGQPGSPTPCRAKT